MVISPLGTKTAASHDDDDARDEAKGEIEEKKSLGERNASTQLYCRRLLVANTRNFHYTVAKGQIHRENTWNSLVHGSQALRHDEKVVDHFWKRKIVINSISNNFDDRKYFKIKLFQKLLHNEKSIKFNWLFLFLFLSLWISIVSFLFIFRPFFIAISTRLFGHSACPRGATNSPERRITFTQGWREEREKMRKRERESEGWTENELWGCCVWGILPFSSNIPAGAPS